MIYFIFLVFMFSILIGIAFSKYKTYRSLINDQKQIIQSLELKLEFAKKQLQDNQIHANLDFATKVVSNYFSDKIEITYFCQLFKGGIPIGSPTVLKVDHVKVYDKEQIQKVLSDFAVPLLKGGIKVALLGL